MLKAKVFSGDRQMKERIPSPSVDVPAPAAPEILPAPDKIPSLAEVTFLAFPLPTHRALSDEAAKRGITLAQALKEAIDLYLARPVDSGK